MTIRDVLKMSGSIANILTLIAFTVVSWSVLQPALGAALQWVANTATNSAFLAAARVGLAIVAVVLSLSLGLRLSRWFAEEQSFVREELRRLDRNATTNQVMQILNVAWLTVSVGNPGQASNLVREARDEAEKLDMPNVTKVELLRRLDTLADDLQKQHDGSAKKET